MLPECIGANTADIPFDNLEGIFFQFDSRDEINTLVIGGPDWEHFKGCCAINGVRPLTEEEAKSVDSDFLERFSRSKLLRERSLRLKKSRNPWAIEFRQFCLHDWKPLLRTLRQLNIPVSLLLIGAKISDPSNFCILTEMGAETLGWVMNPKKSGFSIGSLCLYSRHTSRSIHSKWIHGMMPDGSQERVICKLALQNAPSWFLSDFLRGNCKIKNASYKSQVGDDDGTEMISFAVMMGNSGDVDTTANKFFQEAKSGFPAKERVGIVHTMVIELGHDITSTACQSLSLMLASTRFQTMIVNFVGFKRGIDYDCLFKSTKLCSQLIIQESQSENENHLFPCDGLASWVEAPSGVFPKKSLAFQNNGQRRQGGLRMLLKRTDLSSLGTFRVHCISIRDSAFSALCQQLGENKGPRHLWIAMNNKYCNHGHKNNKNDHEALQKFVKSLRRNNKVEELDIDIINLSLTNAALLRFIQSVSEDMSALKNIKFHHTKEQKLIMYSGRKRKDGCPDDRDKAENEYGYARVITSKVGDEHRKKNIVVQLIGKSSSTTHSHLRFDDNGLESMMAGVEKFQPLLRCGDHAVPDGIWSYALSCTNIVTPNVMFRVLQQMPSLLKRNGGEDDNLLPMFAVPHHPSCPACQRNDSEGKVRVLQGRYCGERFVVHKEGVIPIDFGINARLFSLKNNAD